MLDINIEDVLNIVKLCKNYLIFFAVAAVLAIIVMAACKKMERAKKYLIRSQAGIALTLVLILTVNMICFGPMNTILSLATGSGTISVETTEEAKTLAEAIADEGIVLLNNDDNLLPLSGNRNLNVFGWAATNPCYGGTGSGALSDAYPTVSLLEGLKNAGFTLNNELSDFYTSYRADRPKVGMWEQDWTLPEPPAANYTSEMLANAVNFSDTAMIVITRVGGEGADLPTDMSTVTYNNNSDAYSDFAAGQHFLQLSKSEQDMIDLVCTNFENVILVYNGANAFELGFVSEYDQIKSVLWCAGTGQTGFNGLGSVVSGNVNPSGKTIDTFVNDLTATPYYNNIGTHIYDNADEFTIPGKDGKNDKIPSFVNYVEGIYVGYRFYETAAAEGLIDYESVVAYPFGYGLSYTTFTQEMGALTVQNGTVSVDVTVTNTGSAAGKEVVQIYYNPPYYNGGIEKAAANLAAFDKTDVLGAGESQTLTLTFLEEDMASYDAYQNSCYVLEQGDYGISIRKDSHTIIAEQTYQVAETIVYDENNHRSTDEIVAENQFADAEGEVVYLSRENGFANYAKAVAAPVSNTMSAAAKSSFYNHNNYKPEDFNDPADEMPVTGAKNGVKLADLRGAAYDDLAWEPLLDQLTVSDMNTLIALGGYQTAEIKSVEKYSTVDCDGPASINNNFTKVGSIGFPSAVMIAGTFNEDLALRFGESIGKMADEMNVSGWYAPAMNGHRSAFAGRNFEYYSEDGLLAGKFAAQAAIGAEKYGVYAYLKHFALNDQEEKRNEMLCTWSTEQAIREIYLKPFEIAVKEGQAKAIMSAFNFIGVEWAGASDALLNTVLRDEWGFNGMVLTDYFSSSSGYMDADIAIRNGNDCCLANYDSGHNYVADTASATSIKAMRQASKNIMYTVVNSRAYNQENQAGGLLGWQKAAIGIDVVLIAALAAIELLLVKKGYQKRKQNIEIT